MEKNTINQYIGINMSRKAKPVRKKERLLKELEVIEQEIKEIEEEDNAKIGRITEHIKELEETEKVFLGIVLFKQDIFLLLDQIIAGQPYIKIPTQILHLEEE